MPEQALPQSRVVRRRNPRPINSCVECRTRKSRCSKTHPCQNCTAFGRECIFITVPESAARKKQREREQAHRTSVDWTQQIPVRPQSSSAGGASSSQQAGGGSVSEAAKFEKYDRESVNASTTTPGTPPRDYEWEAYQQHVQVDGGTDAWEKLPAEPEETPDDVYEDENDDEDEIATDLTIRIGRMIICENITGFFRPQYAEELGKLLSEHPSSSTSSVAGQRAPHSSALLSAEHMPSLSPSLNLLLGGSISASQNCEIESPHLPTRMEADALFNRYLEAVSPLAHVLHIPSFKRLYERFWMNVEIGNPNQNSCTALVLAVCMAAAASVSPLQAKSQFGITKEELFLRLQKATERALLRANWAKTSNIRTVQALTIYLIPLCRAQISRATSVVVGALVRLAQCIGIHRLSHSSAHTLTPLQRHVRSLLWYQICFLDFKTAEAQGPHPSIRSDDFDIPLPLNVDDNVFEFGTPEWQHDPTSINGFTDVTLSLIRYECNEIHRLIFRGRIEMDRKTITLHDLRARVEAEKRHVENTYLRYLDKTSPIQRYAGLVATLLMSRCDSMLLYRHLPQANPYPRSDSENRLRDVLLSAALTTLEIGATLDTHPPLSSWAWYSTTYQQYHAVLLLLTELYRTPDLENKERMQTIIDHIFGHCYGVGVRERCSDLLWTVKENLEAFYIMKGIPKRSTTSLPSTSALPTSSLQHHQQQQQHPGLQSRSSHSQQTQPPHLQRQQSTRDLSQLPMTGLTPMENLSVDFETLLDNFAPPGNANAVNVNGGGVDTSGGAGGAGGGGSSVDDFNTFFQGMQGNSDASAIFVPVDNASTVRNDWGDGTGTRSTGLQQWDNWTFPHHQQKYEG
ncbi:hypothetical protein P280DRAFT_471972 [Massarina eburnea CBS 473.64]|uniref:Zn(2)-C6 fungal-type domain-containing protein n=1 Tax=Massarina eburnea CBS 473.64 TaxID=1395130 RepID=A0A6A6RQU4_9PLEO|nr:hypothetical protein P280DRAFT_471972 [Massarina eburnea CBS 473.64]